MPERLPAVQFACVLAILLPFAHRARSSERFGVAWVRGVSVAIVVAGFAWFVLRVGA